MDIQYLHEFITLAKYGSFTKASAALYIAQPVLSKHMSSLEKTLGCTLFARGQIASELTPIGKVFLKDAKAVIADWDKAAADIKRLRDVKPCTLKVMVFREDKMSVDLLASVQKTLSDERPMLEIVTVAPEIDTPPCTSILRGDADVLVGITDPKMDHGELEFDLLFSDRESITVSNDHRLANRSSIDVAELTDEKILMPTAASISEMKSQLTNMLLAHGVEPDYLYFDIEEGENYYDFDFTEGVFPAPVSLVLYNMPAHLLNRYSMVRLEGKDANIWYYAVRRPDIDNADLNLFLRELKREASELNPDESWEHLPVIEPSR